MTTSREDLEFEPEAAGEVLARMEAVFADRSPRGGWINFHPQVHETADPPSDSSLFGIFSPNGPAVPICTWMPGKWRRDRRDSVSLGVQHATGPRAAARLRDAGIEVPPTWRVRQDHPRRGLVVLAPSDQDHETTLAWLLRAGTVLSSVPLIGTWQAAVFRKD